MICKLNTEYLNLSVHANMAATELAPSPSGAGVVAVPVGRLCKFST